MSLVSGLPARWGEPVVSVFGYLNFDHLDLFVHAISDFMLLFGSGSSGQFVSRLAQAKKHPVAG
ncbi:MAG: hypothetical protein NT166_06015 [Candidatus Aminicenantes bacterium]|nr:hypothetical protein [Candidatus Aminicenantes bacterium]